MQVRCFTSKSNRNVNAPFSIRIELPPSQALQRATTPLWPSLCHDGDVIPSPAGAPLAYKNWRNAQMEVKAAVLIAIIVMAPMIASALILLLSRNPETE